MTKDWELDDAVMDLTIMLKGLGVKDIEYLSDGAIVKYATDRLRALHDMALKTLPEDEVTKLMRCKKPRKK